jgi:hypothetical protein
MIARIHRRTALKFLAATLAAPALAFAVESKPAGAKWKTAIGLNGFQSGSRKYKKNYPIWQVCSPASKLSRPLSSTRKSIIGGFFTARITAR